MSFHRVFHKKGPDLGKTSILPSLPSVRQKNLSPLLRRFSAWFFDKTNPFPCPDSDRPSPAPCPIIEGQNTPEGGSPVQDTVVYLDVLFFLNLFTNLLLLGSTALLTKSRAKALPLLVAAGVGALYSLTFLLRPMPLALLLPVRLLLASLMLVIAFPYQGLGAFLRGLASFLFVNLLFTGAILLLRTRSGHIYLSNGVVYYNISLLTLALCTTAAYLLIALICRIRRGRPDSPAFSQVKLTANGKTLLLRGFWDTGNGLADCFTGLPVVVCSYDALAPCLTPAQRNYAKLLLQGGGVPPGPAGELGSSDTGGIRPVIFHTAGGTGLLPAFRPDFFALSPEGKGQVTPYPVLAALSPAPLVGGDAQVLLNRRLLSSEKTGERELFPVTR